MPRRLIRILTLAASASATVAALAQDDKPLPKARSFEFAEPAKKPAVGVEVVPKPTEPVILKRWRLDKGGATAMGVTVYVTEVQLWSDGRMRWNLSFWNRSNETQTLFFDFESMVIADSQSNPYSQLGRHIISGNRGSIFMHGIPRDQRFNTWVDYKAPEEPTTTFKVGVALEGRHDHRADAFKPFLVTLDKPLFLKDGVFEAKPARAARAIPEADPGNPADPGEVPISGGDVGPPAKSGRAPAPPAPPPPSTPEEAEELAENFRAFSEEGRWVEGYIFVGDKYQFRVKLAFKKRPRGEFVEATLVSLSGPDRQFEGFGAYFEDLRSPSGLALKLRDVTKLVLTLKLVGKDLEGSDTAGNRYRFPVPEKK